MTYDILCFSHLRWNFVYQRPQHLMTRFSRHHRIFFIEEPLFDSKSGYDYHICKHASANVHVIIPHLEPGLDEEANLAQLRGVVRSLLQFQAIETYVSWYYSPMALAFSDQLHPTYTIYDCMDELSAFLFAPAALKLYEQALFKKADIVFTGGHSLYQAKKHQHCNIYLFASSIDKQHFYLARRPQPIPQDQRSIPAPRFGFYGVIDERFDIDLLRMVAERRLHWQFVLIGPTVKIDPAMLPTGNNIHYLGAKSYDDLPQYLAGWDVAIMPFARNESTRFISPTKTPEYLAGGKPVIASSITDVVTSYGDKGLVSIADTAEEFIDAAENILQKDISTEWLDKVDAFLADMSWDRTVDEMHTLIERGIAEKKQILSEKEKFYV